MKQLHEVLNARVDAGIPVQFWLRDDDAVEPTPKLDQLLALADRFAVPLTLALSLIHISEPTRPY